MWDLYGKAERKPVWKLLADMTPKQLVSCIDFRYITDVLTPEEAFEMLDRQARTKAVREAELLKTGYPGIHDVRRLDGLFRRQGSRGLPRGMAEGWTHFKVKVGADPEDDTRRVGLVRDAIGPSRTLMVDANQRWDVGEAIARMARPRAVQTAVDRGTDEPGRRARVTPRSRARSGRSASLPASIAPIA